MPIIVDSNGIVWLRPSNINCSDVAKRVMNFATAAEIKKSYASGLDDLEWKELLEAIRDIIRNSPTPLQSNEIMTKEINERLAPYALALPTTSMVKEVREIHRLTDDIDSNLGIITKKIILIVMHPRLRALQLVGRFDKLEPFNEFSYIIESATISFYRGNIVCSFLAILPVIEGVILRLLGYPSTTSQKPSFSEIKNYIKKSPEREPFPFQLHFMDSWIEAVSNIMSEHLYKNTRTADAYGFFNRHLALHMLEDKTFCTPENVMRAFLLLDIMTDIFIRENRLEDPRFKTTHEEEAPHLNAYLSAEASGISRNQPEKLLSGYQKYKFS